MIDILDPNNISIINRDKLTFLYRQKLIPSDEIYDFTYTITDEEENNSSSQNSSSLSSNSPSSPQLGAILNSILNNINVNVVFPPKISMSGKNYLFRKRKKILDWKLFKAGIYNENDTPIKMLHDGMFVLINAGLEHGETIYFNDEEVTMSTGQNIVKLVKKDEIVNVNVGLSEDNIVLIWFVVHYELEE